MDRDEQIRAAALQRVAALSSRFAETIPWSELGAGFMVGGERLFSDYKIRDATPLYSLGLSIFSPRQNHWSRSPPSRIFSLSSCR